MGQISLQAPVVGQPNSTEDPKIASNFSTLQTVINGGLDPTNLNPTGGVLSMAFRNGAANLNANAGDWVVAVPGITVTLPAPALNAVVAVTANGSVSGASPVTVAYGSAAIFGPGMSAGVTSFLLGSPIASAILQGNGSQWVIRDGQQDTGWVALGFGSTGVSQGTGYVPGLRLIGDRVWLRGAVLNPTGGNLNWQPAQVATTFRPASTAGLAWSQNASVAPTTGTMSTTGLLSIGPIQVGATASVDGASYSLT